jgi:hypothetical protein
MAKKRKDGMISWRTYNLAHMPVELKTDCMELFAETPQIMDDVILRLNFPLNSNHRLDVLRDLHQATGKMIGLLEEIIDQ